MFRLLALGIFGLVVGAIARFLVPGRDPMPWWGTILLGVVGSLVGGFIASLFWRPIEGELYFAGWIMSTVGAIITLLLWRRFGSRTV